MKKTIIFTGTPGTGKTTLAKEVSLLLKNKLIIISDFAKNNNLFEYFDKNKETYEVNYKKLNKLLINEINKSEDLILIEGHMSHFLPKKYVDLCFVCKTELKELKNRLNLRQYNEQKVKENLECEIFDVCLTEALELGHNVKIINTNSKEDLQNNLKIIIDEINKL
jgi:adenylate kinase